MNIFIDLMYKYGFVSIIIFLVVALTQITKKLFLQKAITEIEKQGYDKLLITKNIMYIPYVYSFALYVLYHLIIIKFDFNNFNYNEVISNSLMIALAAIALYEQIKIQLEAYKLKKTISQNDNESID